MKYLKQFCVIIGFSFLGELCHMWIPWPIPASIYGIALLFLGLTTGLVPQSAVEPVGTELVSLLPLLFVAPTVSLLDYWSLIAPKLVQILAIVVVSTGVVFFVSGKVTQLLLGKGKGDACG